jgi:hypothetical protein
MKLSEAQKKASFSRLALLLSERDASLFVLIGS